MKRLILPLWILAVFSLLLYSFTQVDLSLTFSKASVFQSIEKGFQYIGWFNRPLSAVLFLIILALLFGLYIATLNLINKKELKWSRLWKIIICISVFLFFAYNAFSYDLFNYIFDAKILVHYHQNPYIHKALDFPGDPMLSFMRWTHRTYPYGPMWLVITAPVYFLGFGKFIITFYLFKFLMVASYLGSVLIIKRIAKQLNFDPNFSAAAFAFNPLVLVEILVSAHNDIVMIFLGLLGLSLFLEKKYISFIFSVLASILIKFATVFLLPGIFIKQFTKISNENLIKIIIISAILVTIAASLRTNFQPWYLLYILPFTSFLQKKYYISIPVLFISIAGLLQYLPYLYLGNWDAPVPIILNFIMIGSIVLSVIIILISKSSMLGQSNKGR